MSNKEMTPGLKILIERMREHPEDFMADYSTDYVAGSKLRRWNELISITNSMVEQGHFSDEEVQAWDVAKKRLSLDTYNARVLDAVNYVPPAESVGYQEATGSLGIGQQYATTLGRSMAQTKEAVLSGFNHIPTGKVVR